MMPVSSEQRFTSQHSCPVCGGVDKAPRGQGVRCYGFLSTDGKMAHCTNANYAGTLTLNANSSTYAHVLVGACPCGVQHDPRPEVSAAPVKVRTPRGEVDVVYDYHSPEMEMVYQVVRMILPDGGKTFRQRRPDGQGGWLWNLSGVQRYLYRLPSLIASPQVETVFIVEGEKDVDRLRLLGAVATTNAQGAGKWRHEYTEYLRDRHVVIIPDNDPPNLDRPVEHLVGQKHAMVVAKSVARVAASVKVLELPGLPIKGDVSDWLDAGGTMEQLSMLAAAAPFHTQEQPYLPSLNGHLDAAALAATLPVWEASKWRSVAQKLVDDGLLVEGDFIEAEGRHYYLNNSDKTVSELGSFDFETLISEKYQLNSTEALYKYMLKALPIECAVRGRRAQISTFAHYEPKENLLFLDLGKGRILKLDGSAIEEVDNGSHGVLFSHHQDIAPWDFHPEVGKGLIARTLIRPLNFVQGEGAPHDAKQQRILLYVWMLSIAFESVQPTKPLALAMGPTGSGKSSLFRYIGRMFYGPSYEVIGIRKEGEKDFFVATTNHVFVTFDNVDQYIPWLEDALATSATGTKITERVPYENNKSVSYVPRAFLSLTARTPRFRREDVSTRILPFRLEVLEEKVGEYVLLDQVIANRDLLMSEYAVALNKVVGITEFTNVNTGLRLADFGNIATRIGASMGIESEIAEILTKLETSQHLFATEENDLFQLLDIWVQEESRAGDMPMTTPNEGREVSATELYTELKALADAHGYKWYLRGANALGVQIRELEPALSIHFEIMKGRHNKKRSWKFTRQPELVSVES